MKNLALLALLANLSLQQSIIPLKKQDLPTLTPTESTDKPKIPLLNDEKLSSNKEAVPLTTQKKTPDSEKSITIEVPTLPILPKSTMMRLIKANTSKVLSNSTPSNIADPINIIKSQKQVTQQENAQKNIVMQGMPNPIIKQQNIPNTPGIGFEEFYGSLRKFIIQKAKNSINDTPPNQTKIEPVQNIRTVAEKTTQNTVNSK